MQQNALKELHKLVRGKILCNIPLSRYTSLRVGGPAEIMIYPLNIMELQKLINFSRTHKVPYFILGRGTNLLIKDGGVRGIVIKLSRGFKKIQVVETLRNHTRLLVESGVSLRRLLNFSAEKGLSGLEFLSGIPGSMGGALWMNSGAYGRQMQDVTESLTLMTPKAEVVEKKRNQLNFDYRQLRLPTGTIIMNALIRTQQENPKKITAEIEKNKKRRSKNQPLHLPSAGSVFKNPPGKSAGQLVEKAGLKGFQVGEAKISEKHANFIINRGNATAEDILSLMKIVHNRVYQVTGIRLESEIKIAGESERPSSHRS